jgi:hypothetical protein
MALHRDAHILLFADRAGISACSDGYNRGNVSFVDRIMEVHNKDSSGAFARIVERNVDYRPIAFLRGPVTDMTINSQIAGRHVGASKITLRRDLLFGQLASGFHFNQLAAHNIPLAISKDRVDDGGGRGKSNERLHSSPDAELVESIGNVEAAGQQEPNEGRNIWFGAIICVLGVVSVEKGLQLMARPECIRRVIGLLVLSSEYF